MHRLYFFNEELEIKKAGRQVCQNNVCATRMNIYVTTPPCGHPNHVHMVVIVDHCIVGTQFIASANDVSDAMNRVPTIQRMHSSNKSLLPSPDAACEGNADG